MGQVIIDKLDDYFEGLHYWDEVYPEFWAGVLISELSTQEDGQAAPAS